MAFGGDVTSSCENWARPAWCTDSTKGLAFLYRCKHVTGRTLIIDIHVVSNLGWNWVAHRMDMQNESQWTFGESLRNTTSNNALYGKARTVWLNSNILITCRRNFVCHWQVVANRRLQSSIKLLLCLLATLYIKTTGSWNSDRETAKVSFHARMFHSIRWKGEDCDLRAAYCCSFPSIGLPPCYLSVIELHDHYLLLQYRRPPLIRDHNPFMEVFHQVSHAFFVFTIIWVPYYVVVWSQKWRVTEECMQYNWTVIWFAVDYRTGHIDKAQQMLLL